MAVSSQPPANGFVAAMRKLYNPIGFTKGYNFTLWFIFAGAMLGFCLARIMYLDFNGIYCSPFRQGMNSAGPGECWAYNSKTRYLIGIKMHLYTIIPAGILVCAQFTPVIRHKFILVHRITGYLVIALSLVAIVGALMVASGTFGGTIETQTGIGFVAILFVGSLAISYYNVKRLQIEQHRAWMLRAWFYAGSIITLRIISILAITVKEGTDEMYKALPCREVIALAPNVTQALAQYPICQDENAFVAVKGSLSSNGAAGAAAAMQVNFGMALWLAFAIHAVGVEVYLQLTPKEAERLRNVSYQRQLEAGYSNPGSAGLTVDRLGDSNRWSPTEKNGS